MKDILGQAISDYYAGDKDDLLWVHDKHGPKVEMPVATYFRTEDEMPELELKALERCKGSVLDIGAGAGSHAIVLKERGLTVTAMDISPLAAGVMKARGLQNVIAEDIFNFQGQKFNTLLLLMNGIGLTGNMEGLRRFLQHAQTLLLDGGQLLFDSSDVAYLYEDDIPVLDHYYGIIACRYEYKKKKTDWFHWLYIDQHTLKLVADTEGWNCEILFEDDNDQYLARLTFTDGFLKTLNQ